MRFLLLWILLTMIHGSANLSITSVVTVTALSIVFLGWDIWEFARPQPVIFGGGKPAEPVDPLVGKVAELLRIRTACAQKNDCVDCQKFLTLFTEGHAPDTADVAGAVPDIPGVPHNGPATTYDPQGYL